MLSSYPPFYEEEHMKVYQKIADGHVKYPIHFSSEAIDLISRLLEPNPSKRLGCTAGGAEAIKTHPWFKDLDWLGLYNQTLRPPIVPQVRDNTDTSNFPEYEDSESDLEPPRRQGD